MKRQLTAVFILGLFCAFNRPLAVAADAKSYQVTGPVVELTDTTITVQKGEDKWQLARPKGTKVNGDLKVGSKVTIYYQMVATEVEVKADKKSK